MKYSYKQANQNTSIAENGANSCDLAIVSASWEKRSLSALELLSKVDVKKIILIRFENSGKTGISGNIRNKYKEFCKKNAIVFYETSIDSVNNDYAYLAEKSSEIDREVYGYRSVFFDITSIPRILWASVVSLWDRMNSVRKIYFFYSTPNYVFQEDLNKSKIFAVTEGDWELNDIAFTSPVFGSGLNKVNFISTGYEYDSLKKILYKLEADINYIIYADPGFNEEYTDLARKTTVKIKNVFEYSEERFIPFGVNKFIDMKDGMNAWVEKFDKMKNYELTFVCAGNKIHTLAFLYVYFENKNIRIRTRVPKKYVETATEPTGGYDIVVVENLFCPI